MAATCFVASSLSIAESNCVADPVHSSMFSSENTEALNIIVMHSDGRCGAVLKAGSVDTCRKEIIDLLEGGADAFKRRSRRYHLDTK